MFHKKTLGFIGYEMYTLSPALYDHVLQLPVSKSDLIVFIVIPCYIHVDLPCGHYKVYRFCYFPVDLPCGH